jgi:anti-sigma28 factor (negative regulator of flagellin synthesis)
VGEVTDPSVMKELSLMFDIALADRGPVEDPRHSGSRPVNRSGRGGDRSGRLDPISEADTQRWTQMLCESDFIRWTRVRSIQQAISQGEYLTDQRLDAAVDGLLADLS